MIRPPLLFLAPPFSAPAGWPGCVGRAERGGRGMGWGLPTRGRLDVAQINSTPISSWANLEADQTGNSTVGGVEPGFVSGRPTPPPPASPPEPKSQPEPNYPRSRHALRLREDRGGSLTPPEAQGCPTLPGPQPGGWWPTALSPGQAGTSLSPRRICGQRPRVTQSCPGGRLWGHRRCPHHL